MPTTPRILAFGGSLRAESFNQKLIRTAADGAKAAGAEVTVIHLRDYPLPVFDEDIERRDGLHENARKLKELFKAHHGLLIGCPEYNSGITAALKNAIDWVSRPAPGEKPLECFTGKIAGLLAASPGALGGIRGLPYVRHILSNIGVIVLPDQFALAVAHEAMDANGRLKDDSKRAAAERVGAAVAQTLSQLLT